MFYPQACQLMSELSQWNADICKLYSWRLSSVYPPDVPTNSISPECVWEQSDIWHDFDHKLHEVLYSTDGPTIYMYVYIYIHIYKYIYIYVYI